MINMFNKIGNFFVKAITFNNNISSTRLIAVWSGFVFSVSLIWGFGIVLVYYKDLIIQYAGILLGGLLGTLGVKAYEKKGTMIPIVEQNDDTNIDAKTDENAGN